jgi:hypothetical protein
MSEMQHPSLADIPESELVQRLLSDIQWRHRIIGIRGIETDSLAYDSVPLKGLPDEPKGDIDILLVPPNTPSEATVVQVKRIKVGAPAFHTDMPNKMKELPWGAQQANLLADIGFAQVYLFVFVTVDSRERNAGRYTYEGMTGSLQNIVDAAVGLNGLDPRVGLIQFEFVQPMDDVPLGLGTYGGNLKRLATPAIQPLPVTQWIEGVMKERQPVVVKGLASAVEQVPPTDELVRVGVWGAAIWIFVLIAVGLAPSAPDGDYDSPAPMRIVAAVVVLLGWILAVFFSAVSLRIRGEGARFQLYRIVAVAPVWAFAICGLVFMLLLFALKVT